MAGCVEGSLVKSGGQFRFVNFTEHTKRLCTTESHMRVLVHRNVS